MRCCVLSVNKNEYIINMILRFICTTELSKEQFYYPLHNLRLFEQRLYTIMNKLPKNIINLSFKILFNTIKSFC